MCANCTHSYEWGYTYGPPMAVAPIGAVRRVVEFALTQMEPGKILLGFPNYAYDWTLPFTAGATRAQSIGISPIWTRPDSRTRSGSRTRAARWQSSAC